MQTEEKRVDYTIVSTRLLVCQFETPISLSLEELDGLSL